MISHEERLADRRDVAPWPIWCCPYCSGRLDVMAHGLSCRAEGRWFARQNGVHRLLTEERRAELRPLVDMYGRVRRDEGWASSPELPAVDSDHPHAELWKRRAKSFARALELAEQHLGTGPWRVLDAGAGSGWASARLMERGHHVVAVDINLDAQDGLGAASRLQGGGDLAIAECDLESLPFEPQTFDLVLAGASLHYSPRLVRTLVELRRVTRRGGALVVFDSPVYKRRPDGEAMVAERMRAHVERYGFALPREQQSNYLVLGEVATSFMQGGWAARTDGWPKALREWLSDRVEILKKGRRTARFPAIVAMREG